MPADPADGEQRPDVTLREVEAGDLEFFYGYQCDAEAARMADFPQRDREAFLALWGRILGNEAIRKRTVLVDGAVAGHIVGFPDDDGRREVGYWLGREFWGRGVATRALAAFLEIEPERPLYAHTAADNIASRRVLEKNGFHLVAEDDTGVTLRLDGT